MGEQTPITWAGVAAAIEFPWGELTAGLRQTSKMLLRPDDHGRHVSAERVYMDAFGHLYLRAETAVEQIKDLRERLYADRPAGSPARPLEVVLAEIEAEGHEVVEVRRSPRGRWTCESKRNYEGHPANGDSEAWAAWRVSVEDGEAGSDAPAAAAEARLAQIRELHAAKAAAITEHVEAWAVDEGRVAGEEARRESEASESAQEIRDRLREGEEERA